MLTPEEPASHSLIARSQKACDESDSKHSLLPCWRQQGVQRTSRRAGCNLQHMGIDHRGAAIAVPKQLLHGPDIGIGLK